MIGTAPGDDQGEADLPQAEPTKKRAPQSRDQAAKLTGTSGPDAVMTVAERVAKWRSRDARRARIVSIEISEEMLLALIDARFLREDDAGSKRKIAAAIEALHAVLTKSNGITQPGGRHR